MKNKGIKNAIFCIAMIPYAVLVIMCIYYAIAGYGYNLGKTAYGIVAIGNFLPDIFSDILDKCFEPFPLCTAVLWVGYQLYYLISFKSDKKVDAVREKNGNASKKVSIRKIIFWISVSCWGVYFASGIVAFFDEVGFFGSSIEDGMDALADTLLWNLFRFSIIPILPITLLYIIIYVVVKMIDEKKR